ncbi:hypothetical protein QUF63_00865 [Anaerolineales bacterium HSG25]|nr:hypothetical protein [Anaerolineales bacterium HSG25]
MHSVIAEQLYLLTLINDVLDLAKIESDKLFALIAEHLGLEWIYEETADIIETDVISTEAELIPPPPRGTRKAV